MKSFYCRGCGNKIDQNNCPHCGKRHNIIEEHEEPEHYMIKDGTCSNCGRKLSKAEIKNNICLGCKAEFVNGGKMSVLGYIAVGWFFISMIATILDGSMLKLIKSIPAIIGVIIVIGAFLLIIKIYEWFMLAEYDYYHDVYSKSDHYQRKHHLGKYDTNRQILDKMDDMQDQINKMKKH